MNPGNMQSETLGILAGVLEQEEQTREGLTSDYPPFRRQERRRGERRVGE